MALDPQVAELLAFQASLHLPPLRSVSLSAARAAYDAGANVLDADPPQDLEVEDLVIPGADGGLRARRFVPTSARPGMLLWLHGGGWIQGSLESHDAVFRRLAAGCARSVLAVEYRLAPEHPFPAGVLDAVAAFEWMAATAEGTVAIGGDSAGATLALVASNLLRGAPQPPAFQVLAYPALGPDLVTDSLVEFGEGLGLSADDVAYLYSLYLTEEQDRSDPRVSPLLTTSLAGAPPAIVSVAGFDVLRDEGLAYVGLLRGAHVDVELLDETTLIHGYLRMSGLSSTSLAAMERLTQSMRRRFDRIEEELR